MRLPLLASISLATAACALDSPYLDPDGPRYEGDFVSEAPIAGPTLKVVTFNLEFGLETDIAIAALETPELAGFDILAMQEMNPDAMDAIARGLGLRYVYYPASVKKGSDFGNGILTRWPMAGDHKIILPHADPYVGTRRIAVSADITVGETVVRLYSTHTATLTVGLGARLDQLEAIALDARSSTRPTIIAGDLNTADFSSGDQTVDLFRDFGFSWASSDALDSGSGYNGRFTLDYIFTRSLPAGASGTFDGEAGSDHQPIWVEIPMP